METAVLEKDGTLKLPAHFLQKYQWQQGQSLQLFDTEWGIMLRTTALKPRMTLSEVAGCLPYHGEPKTLQEMEDAIQQGANSQNI